MAAVKAIARIAFGRFDPWEGDIRTNLDARYAASFVDLAEVRLEAFDAVVPLQRAHYVALGGRPDQRGRKFFHPAPEVSDLCHDKLALNRFLIANGFAAAVPPLRASGPPYPYVWKRRRGGGGRECHLVDGPQAQGAIDRNDHDWFAQVPVAGATEYATHILRAGGIVRYASTFTYELAGPMQILGQRASPLTRRHARGCEHLALFADILARLGYEGTACFDYKLADGRPLVFEINPRFGGSLGWDMNAYLDAYVAALDQS